MSNFTDFIGGGGGATLDTIILHTSQTWTPPFNGTARIHVIGSGSSGAGGSANSGGSGGYGRKDVTLSTGTNWTITVGAGGVGGLTVSISNGSLSRATNGSDNILANGGTFTSGASVGSGGDVNRTGQNGLCQNYGGGGAVHFYSDPTSSTTTGTSAGGQTTDASLGDFTLLGLGQIFGGVGGNAGVGHGANGGAFCGGGAQFANLQYGYSCVGGSGCLGGGGGACQGELTTRGGNGGDGVIIIQYLTLS